MNTATDRPFSRAAEAIGDLVMQGTRIGLDLLETLAGSSMTDLKRTMMKAMPSMQSRCACGCHIPPPCWAPVCVGEVTSHVCPGASASIRIRVTNCDIAPNTIRIEAAGQGSGVTVTPDSLTLGPMERGVSVVSLTVPATAGSGDVLERLIWIRGCRQHYLRWTVKTSSRGADACHEIEIDDCNDQVHHWYDHFYCPRPCSHRDPAQRQ